MSFKIALFYILGLTNSLTNSLDLRGVFHGDKMAGAPLGPSLGAGEVDVEGVCTHFGTACQNCSLAVTCVALPVGWLKVPLEECRKDQTCNAKLGGCASTPVPECDGTPLHEHSCEQVGIFPDAHDCRKFHLCSPAQGLPDRPPAHHGVARCPRNYGYDPATAQCSVKLPHGQCTETPVPACNKVGETGSIRSSQNHYYVCLMRKGQLQPQVFICPHGWYFWEGYCRPEPPKERIEDKDSSVSSSEEDKETKNGLVHDDINNSELPTKSTDNSMSRQSTTTNKASTKATTETPSTTKFYAVNAFFSTDKPTVYEQDTFLADRFDLSNYETVVEDINHNYEYYNSFENVL